MRSSWGKIFEIEDYWRRELEDMIDDQRPKVSSSKKPLQEGEKARCQESEREPDTFGTLEDAEAGAMDDCIIQQNMLGDPPDRFP